MQITKLVNQLLLQQQLQAGGFCPRGLVREGTDYHSSTPTGAYEDLPAGAQSIVTAHDGTQLTADQQTAGADGSGVQQFMAQADAAINNWATLTATQKDTALLRCLQALRAIARRYS